MCVISLALSSGNTFSGLFQLDFGITKLSIPCEAAIFRTPALILFETIRLTFISLLSLKNLQI